MHHAYTLDSFPLAQKYNLGPNSTLVLNNLTDPSSTFVQSGLETFPMVSSFPYPPQFMWVGSRESLPAHQRAHPATAVTVTGCERYLIIRNHFSTLSRSRSLPMATLV